MLRLLFNALSTNLHCNIYVFSGFDLYQALNSMDTQNMETRRSCQFKMLHFNYL